MYLKAQRDITESQLPECVKAIADWIKPVTMKYGAQTILQSVENYKRYLKDKGRNYLEIEREPQKYQRSQKKPACTKSDKVLKLVMEGQRQSQIIQKYLGMTQQIAKLMRYRPHKEHMTQVLYIWGKTECGKTTTVNKILYTIKKLYNLDYYFKGGGLTRYFDGYDNEPIVVIDDPVAPNSSTDSENIQNFKRICGCEGKTFVEVKYGYMVFNAYRSSHARSAAAL